MASVGVCRNLVKKALFNGQLKAHHLVAARQGSGTPAPWNYLWRPDLKIPVTKEDKAKAARKYGMIEEDYEPLGDTHYSTYGWMDYGDYPKLENKGMNERSPYHNWDFPFNKRDFGEPMYVEYHYWIDTRADTGRLYRTRTEWALGFIVFMGLTVFICFNMPPTYFPMLKQPLVADGPHYYFEPAEE